MKIALAQIASEKGNVDRNIIRHLAFIRQAAKEGADLIVFPELSLTAYEPALARDLAARADDPRFDVLQKTSDELRISIGVGMPLQQAGDVAIGMLLFQPGRPREVYAKQYLHADEEPFFVSGKSTVHMLPPRIAPAICYEVFVPQHAENAAAQGANIYLASVAKSAKGMEKARLLLPDTARKHQMTILLANSVGPSDDFIGAGESSVWRADGSLAGALDGAKEGILLYDAETGSLSLSHDNPDTP